jgi:RHS repeat-associated protein
MKVDFEAIKRTTDIVRVIESYGISLKKSGRDYVGLCPFHDEKTAHTAFLQEGSGMQIGLFRWYDPNLQRWINRDPIGEAGGMSISTSSSGTIRSITLIRGDCRGSS